MGRKIFMFLGVILFILSSCSSDMSTKNNTQNDDRSFTESSLSQDEDREKSLNKQYEALNSSDPVRGEKEWSFYSTEPEYGAINDPSDLSECYITIDESDHVTMFWNYYYKAENHTEFAQDDNKSVKFNGEDYYWFLSYRYEGTCFVQQNGIVNIQLKCTNDFGYDVTDEIELKRDGADKLVVIGHKGGEFYLKEGDEFVR